MAFQPKSTVGRWGWVRVRIFGRLVFRRLGFILGGAYAVLSAAEWALDQFGPKSLVNERLGDHIPNISFWHWASLGLALLCIIIIDGVARGVARGVPIDPDADDRGVAISSAFWGAGPGRQTNVTRVVRDAVKDGRLRIVASNDDLVGGLDNDPAKGHVKTLTVQYRLDGNGRTPAWWWEDDIAILPTDNPPLVSGPPGGRESRD